ncbi:ketosteroid isomerase, partial [Mycobacterium sp. ITM-2017-0098]
MTAPTPTDSTALLTAMYAAEARYLAAGGPGMASFDLLAPFFAPDVVLYQADSLPYGGVWRGHAGMEEFFVQMSCTWESFDMSEQRFLAAGPTAVVLTDVRARARITGCDVAFPILQEIRIADGRISEVRPFYWDTAMIARAAA